MSDKYLTVVFNVADLTHKETAAIVGMQHVSALRWGHAIDELHELEKKVAEYDRLRDAIRFLIEVKEHKDAHGKDDFYADAMPIAWEKAREVLRLGNEK